MKVNTLTAVSLFLILTVSCSKDAGEPQPKYTSLVGSWKMVRNNGVDLKFDIITDPNNSSKLYMAFPYVSYNNQTSTVDSNPSFELKLFNGLYNVDFYIIVGQAGNAGKLENITQNPELTKLTANSGWVSVLGFNSSIPSPYVLNLTSPIIVNRVK